MHHRVRLDDDMTRRCVALYGAVYNAHAEADVHHRAARRAQPRGVRLHERRLPLHHHRVVLRVEQVVALVPHAA